MTRMALRNGWRRDAALVVALFLALQALVSGFATGARAGDIRAGDVICGSASAKAALPDAGRSPALVHLLDCCTLGCPMVGAMAPSPALEPLPRGAAFVAFRALTAIERDGGRRVELAPVLSRAPPRA